MMNAVIAIREWLRERRASDHNCGRNMFRPGGLAVGVSRQSQYLVTRLTTGPQDLLLMLDLADERIADPFVTCIAPSVMYGQPDDAVVRAAVLAGTDRANAECRSSWHPLEIRYWYCGYDKAHCSLMRRAAHEIVSQLHHRGLAGIEVVPEHIHAEPGDAADPTP